jgi:hypothetical protein
MAFQAPFTTESPLMDRSSVTLDCPGTKQNPVVLAAFAGVAQYGIGHPENAGGCGLFIVALDENGTVLEDFLLGPGDSYRWYWPPSGTTQIDAAWINDCHGTAVLEYDTPIC